MGDGARRGLIRLWALAGISALVLTGLNLFFLPVAIIAFVTGVAGFRRIGDDLEAASLRLGVSVLVSLVLAVGGIMTGAGIVAAPAGVLSFGAFLVAWRLCERLREDRRRAWGVSQGLAMQRDRELHDRQRALRDAVRRDPDENEET